MNEITTIGIIGAGSMGSGIAQVAARAGLAVILCDTSQEVLDRAGKALDADLAKLSAKGKITQDEAIDIRSRISFTHSKADFKACGLVIEAVIEDLAVKKQLFREMETIVGEHCLLATNTSSLSVTSIASACRIPTRVLGIHFFNPAPVMPLVEIIPALQTSAEWVEKARTMVESWKKVAVVTKDTPGFIVNRVARPFYGEALRIVEEGIADIPTVDAAMRELGFRMGPFELMDMIGNDINYAVTESVFAAMYHDPRYKPSLLQRKNVEAGWLGKKSGRGFYDYSEGAVMPEASPNAELRKQVSVRILVMLINEAYDALYYQVASADDLDMAMTKGVNYPKGLIAWGQEIGARSCADMMEALYKLYGEDRYRCSIGLRAAMRSEA